MHKYEVIIYWSNEDKVFVAEVPELAGCMAHGHTKADALANADEAIFVEEHRVCTSCGNTVR